MQARFTTLLQTLAILAAAACAPQAAHGAACSDATLQGNYGILLSGTALGNPVAIAGQLSLDGGGGITGLETINTNGVMMISAQVSGTYSLAAGCTGTAAITPSGGTTANYNLVVAAGKVQILSADSGTVQSGVLAPQGISSCPAGTVKGTYSLNEAGFLVGQGPVAYGGQVLLQGGGTVQGTRAGSTNGSISAGDQIAGAYVIDPRCFGAAVLSINHGPPLHFNLVVVNSGREVIFIQIDQDTVIAGSLDR
jgi:hypothetical protein